jgi:D-alanyl-D-alanine carboxypeptidase/D-alanyl-D-alanine-endopeptidase (penicillin-binding protein 4)
VTSGSLAALRRQLDALFDGADFEDTSWGILVRSLRTGETFYANNPTKLMVPASSMKVVTLAATAERLGWDFRFDTRLGTSAPIEDGVVRGDVLVQGNGDPSIVRGDGRWSPVFDTLAAQLASGGVTRIEGRLIGDDNAFEDRGYGVNWAWDDFAYDYSAPIGALQYDENTVGLRIAPGAEGQLARVDVADPAAGLSVTNEVMTVAAAQPTIIDYEPAPREGRVRVTGQIAVDAEPQLRLTAVDNPTLYFVRALRAALDSHGIQVVGEAVDIDDVGHTVFAPGASPAASGTATSATTTSAVAQPLHTLATHQSPRLLEIATRLMMVSQNLIAETFFKQLGLVAAPTLMLASTAATHSGLATPASGPRVATAAAGRDALNDILTNSWGLDARQFVIWDGSGLSRRDYISPLLLVTALTRMAQDPAHKDAFISTLPIGGRDGSLEYRMKGTPAEGNVRAKTGSMSQVRSLTGYVTTADGEPLAFSVIANGFTAPARRVDEAVDSAMDTLARFKR